MFLNKLDLYKSNFETWFYRLTHFTRKLVQGLYACFWTHFVEHDFLYGGLFEL